jgi:hypothetical protein
MQLRSRKRPAVAGICSLIFVLTACITARGQDTNQFYLAAQYDWGQARGFFFVVEGTPQGNHAATIRDVRLTLGVGDGHGWHFVSGTANFAIDTPYQVSVSIRNGSAQIILDGKSLGQTACQFASATGPLMYNQGSGIMRAAADYQVRQQTLHITSGDMSRDLKSLNSAGTAQLAMLNPSVTGGLANIALSNTVTLQTTFQFAPKQSLKELSPFIDQYGQSVQANWVGKVRSDSDLKSAQKIEAQRFATWGTPGDRDQYGGALNSKWKDTSTGFFHLARRDGKWWLITPEGNPCFYLGLSNAPAYTWEDTPITGREYLFSWLPDRTGTFAAACIDDAWHSGDGQQYACFHTANLIREFGDNWHQLATDSAVRRVHALGFSGFGKWSDGGLGVSDLPVLGNHGPNLVKHPDVFDPEIRKQMGEALRWEIEARKNDPWLLGWSVGNEKDEDITGDEIRQILAMDDHVPARKALVACAGTSHPDDVKIEQMREYYEQTYYAFVYKTVKQIDPNHLYFGNWVTANYWENENDWRISAANCDVVGFDWYADHFQGDPTGPLIAANDKPILCGEFSFPPTYNGQRGYGTYGTHTSTETEAGEKYTQWIHDAAMDPHCVGAFYFQYRDEPITGRGPGSSRDALVIGEDFAFGLVDVTDRIKWDFAELVRKANLGAGAVRLGGADK